MGSSFWSDDEEAKPSIPSGADPGNIGPRSDMAGQQSGALIKYADPSQGRALPPQPKTVAPAYRTDMVGGQRLIDQHAQQTEEQKSQFLKGANQEFSEVDQAELDRDLGAGVSATDALSKSNYMAEAIKQNLAYKDAAADRARVDERAARIKEIEAEQDKVFRERSAVGGLFTHPTQAVATIGAMFAPLFMSTPEAGMKFFQDYVARERNKQMEVVKARQDRITGRENTLTQLTKLHGDVAKGELAFSAMANQWAAGQLNNLAQRFTSQQKRQQAQTQAAEFSKKATELQMKLKAGMFQGEHLADPRLAPYQDPNNPHSAAQPVESKQDYENRIRKVGEKPTMRGKMSTEDYEYIEQRGRELRPLLKDTTPEELNAPPGAPTNTMTLPTVYGSPGVQEEKGYGSKLLEFGEKLNPIGQAIRESSDGSRQMLDMSRRVTEQVREDKKPMAMSPVYVGETPAQAYTKRLERDVKNKFRQSPSLSRWIATDPATSEEIVRDIVRDAATTAEEIGAAASGTREQKEAYTMKVNNAQADMYLNMVNRHVAELAQKPNSIPYNKTPIQVARERAKVDYNQAVSRLREKAPGEIDKAFLEADYDKYEEAAVKTRRGLDNLTKIAKRTKGDKYVPGKSEDELMGIQRRAEGIAKGLGYDLYSKGEAYRQGKKLVSGDENAVNKDLAMAWNDINEGFAQYEGPQIRKEGGAALSEKEIKMFRERIPPKDDFEGLSRAYGEVENRLARAQEKLVSIGYTNFLQKEGQGSVPIDFGKQLAEAYYFSRPSVAGKARRNLRMEKAEVVGPQ